MLKRINLLKDKGYLIDKQVKTEVYIMGGNLEILTHKLHTFSRSNNKLILEKVDNVYVDYRLIKKYKHKIKTIETKYHFIITPSEDKIKYIDRIKKEKMLTSKNIFIKILASDILNIFRESIDDYRFIKRWTITEIVPKVERTRKLILSIRPIDNRDIRSGVNVIIMQEKEIKSYF